jgi:hypothetical protein
VVDAGETIRQADRREHDPCLASVGVGRVAPGRVVSRCDALTVYASVVVYGPDRRGFDAGDGRLTARGCRRTTGP